MSYELLQINPMHRAVMRYMALGIPLPEICKRLDLDLNVWQHITTSAAFQDALQQLLSEYDDRVASEDPILAKLKNLADQAVEVHKQNMDSVSTRPTTAQRAAESILDRLGYREIQSAQTVININISPEKLASLEMADESGEIKSLALEE